MAKNRDTRDALLAEAHAILKEQKRLLAQAAAVAREARDDVGRYANEEIFSRVREGSRRGFTQARHAIVEDVLPAVGSAVGAALNLLEGKSASKAIGTVRKLVSRSAPVVTKAGPGVGTVIAVGVGVAALIGIGYIAYQTFRADDELWIEEGEDG